MTNDALEFCRLDVPTDMSNVACLGILMATSVCRDHPPEVVTRTPEDYGGPVKPVLLQWTFSWGAGPYAVVDRYNGRTVMHLHQFPRADCAHVRELVHAVTGLPREGVREWTSADGSRRRRLPAWAATLASWVRRLLPRTRSG